jgi:pimeloyl-ACP methyl ester carboxylesterase
MGMAEPPAPATYRRSAGVVILDLLLAVTVLPILAAVCFGAVGAWRVYHPRRRPQQQTPESVGMRAERVTVPGREAGDPPLAAWFIPSPTGRDTVVLTHGISRDKTGVLHHAAMLHAAGYHVFAFDLRNHGESGNDGLLRGQAARYIADFRRVVAYLRQRADLEAGRLAFFAFSFSTWPAVQMANVDSAVVRAVICDSGPAIDGGAALKRLLDSRRGSLPLPLRGPILYWALALTLRALAHQILSPTPYPPEIVDRGVRLLFIAGEADPLLPPDAVREIAERYPWSAFWVAPQAPHIQAFRVAPREYTERVTAVLSEAFAGDAVGGAPSTAAAG